MLTPNPPLWRQIPAKTRLDLVPILSTGLLVQAGSSSAELIVRLKDGVPFTSKPNPASVDDITAILLFVNFAIAFWFGYRTLKDAVANREDVRLDAKVVGLAAAFLTALELYSLALKQARPELLSYGLLVLFYVFVVPYFLVRLLTAAKAESGLEETARQALAGMELVLYALTPSAVVVIVCSLYFSVLNDGLALWGIPSSARSSGTTCI
jgi:hypothetical protein